MTTQIAAALAVALAALSAVAVLLVVARELSSDDVVAPPELIRPSTKELIAAALVVALAALAAVALVLVAARALGPDEPAEPQPLMRCDPLEGEPGSLLCYDPNAVDYGG